MQILSAVRYSNGKIDSMIEIINDMKHMPLIMKKLAWVQMLTWFGLFAMFIYCTQAITSYHYGSTDPQSFQKNHNLAGPEFGKDSTTAMEQLMAIKPVATAR